MSDTIALPVPPAEETVGVRELRQRTSEILDRVAKGRAVTVTRNGRSLARLVPAVTAGDPLSELVAMGAATRAEDTGDLLDVVTAPATAGELPSTILARMRDEER